MKKTIKNILVEMQKHLNNKQLKELEEVLHLELHKLDQSNLCDEVLNTSDFVKLFIDAKKLEGCSIKTANYYLATIESMLNHIKKNVNEIETNDLRQYLSSYEEKKNLSKLTIDNIRRILSSFFSWLEDENYILKNPVRRIKKIKSPTVIKETYADEELEIMRDNVENLRDLALIDILSSTGMRVGELVKLNIEDINFQERECIVIGKGNKQRKVYFDTRTKIHLWNYINFRKDNNNALFISLKKPFQRLSINGVESRLKQIGKKLNIKKVHPHKFRRTLATLAIDKGMPIEQVQRLLGHEKIDTTLKYAMVKETNVKNSHKKYIG
ncbi:tyrosine-type recombinase/integrase [Mycoplasma cottewii]|uniref:Tyrosine-type recombinase/integrase n=1 Tax=Mycoplasma cottewii TaxID=51364 RepID=A0ABY5TX09_9MOLU|nr:site-specific tyrosine recombinase/integron integrase [Mycoplasma cottewii]UWD35218.1 tyrosine-type recombinase/integrase [Mycoplasma cottewii]